MEKDNEELTMKDTILEFYRLLDELKSGAEYRQILKEPLFVKAVNYSSINKYIDHIEYPIELTKVTETRDIEYYISELTKIADKFQKLEREIKIKLGLYIQ